MNKILLNILIFFSSQQFILGTEINKEIEPKLGVCLSCYAISSCDHTIYDTYEEGQGNCPYCVQEVYSVCCLGHTMCADCIYDFVSNGLQNEEGVINCVFFNTKKKIGGKNFKPCRVQINKKVVIQILDTLKNGKENLGKKKEKLRKKYIEMQKNLLNKILFLEPQNKECKYEECTGYFDVTKGFICNKNKSHKHCGNCFDKIHPGKCKDPLESENYKFYIEQNTEINKKIQNRELGYGEIEGYKPCPNCHQIIAKGAGCNHMTCGKSNNQGGNWYGKGCGYQWCWRCGKACFCDNPGEPGHEHYSDKNSPCYDKHYTAGDKDDPNYFDDGDYFGIKNGNFKKQFEKLAKELLIDVEVETPVNIRTEIKKKDWDSIIEARKKWQEEPPEKHYAVDDSKNCCTECCYVFTFFQ